MIALLSLFSAPALAEAPAVIFVVRHAEKQVGDQAPKDPPLTEVGEARAERLSALLAKAELAGVYSTDTQRTRSTGAPTAMAHSVQVQIYDPNKPDALAATVREAGGGWLVVGHSNTVPGLVAALGGAEPPAIDDAEYDRLYVVTTVPGGPTSVARLSF